MIVRLRRMLCKYEALNLVPISLNVFCSCSFPLSASVCKVNLLATRMYMYLYVCISKILIPFFQVIVLQNIFKHLI